MASERVCVTERDIAAAAESGDVARLRAILDRDPKRVNEFSPLHGAIGQCQVDAVRFLIERGADVNAIDYGGRPLHLVAVSDTSDNKIAQLLIEHGADVNAEDGCGITPIYAAARSAHPHARGLIALLKAGGASYGVEPAALLGDVERQLPVERQIDLFDWVVSTRHQPCPTMKLLLDHGSNPNGEPDRPPLTKTSDAAAVELLLRYGADVNALDSMGRTPLARARGNPELQEVLRRFGGKARLPKSKSPSSAVTESASGRAAREAKKKTARRRGEK